MFLALVESSFQEIPNIGIWLLLESSSLGSLVACGGAQWPLHSWGHKDELKNQCQGCCCEIYWFWETINSFKFSCGPVRGFLASHFVQTYILTPGQTSSQSQGPCRSLWGLPLGVWLVEGGSRPGGSARPRCGRLKPFLTWRSNVRFFRHEAAKNRAKSFQNWCQRKASVRVGMPGMIQISLASSSINRRDQQFMWDRESQMLHSNYVAWNYNHCQWNSTHTYTKSVTCHVSVSCMTC